MVFVLETAKTPSKPTACGKRMLLAPGEILSAFPATIAFPVPKRYNPCDGNRFLAVATCCGAERQAIRNGTFAGAHFVYITEVRIF
jgi:hypothetical protein